MRRAAVLIVVVLLSGAAAARDRPAKADPETARQDAVMTKVKLLVLQHKLAEAVPLAEQVIAAGEARAATEKRQVYSGQTSPMVLANMMLAAGEKRDAIDIGPSYGEALFFKGFALVDLGRAAEAGAFLDRAVAVSPMNAQFLCEDASWHAQQHELDAAADLYRRCRSESGLMADKDTQARFDAAGQRGQGYVLIEQGRLDEAEAVYLERLKADPDDDKAKNELLYIRRQREKAARATT